MTHMYSKTNKISLALIYRKIIGKITIALSVYSKLT